MPQLHYETPASKHTQETSEQMYIMIVVNATIHNAIDLFCTGNIDDLTCGNEQPYVVHKRFLSRRKFLVLYMPQLHYEIQLFSVQGK